MKCGFSPTFQKSGAEKASVALRLLLFIPTQRRLQFVFRAGAERKTKRNKNYHVRHSQ